MGTITARVKYLRCCNRESEYLITYDCGPDPQQTMLDLQVSLQGRTFSEICSKDRKTTRVNLIVRFQKLL